MPRLFKEVELPSTCYVQEAVYWLAFGRVPEFHFQDDLNDQRMGEYACQTGSRVEFDPGFTEAEFRSVGVEVDYPRYVEARQFVQEQDSEQYIANLDARFARFQPEAGQDIAEFERWKRDHLDRLIRDVGEGQWAREMDDVLAEPVNRARLRIFEALMTGDIKALGWVANPLASDEDEDQGAFQEVPSAAWTFQFDWADSKLSKAGKTYRAVQVHTENMLSIFPNPDCASGIVSLRAYPGVAIIHNSLAATDEKPQIKAGNQRGRPGYKVSLGDVVRAWYRTTYKDQGRMPPKAKSLLTEAAAWVADTFNQKIPRSTMHSWLKSEARLPDEMPEKDARNSSGIAAE